MWRLSITELFKIKVINSSLSLILPAQVLVSYFTKKIEPVRGELNRFPYYTPQPTLMRMYGLPTEWTLTTSDQASSSPCASQPFPQSLFQHVSCVTRFPLCCSMISMKVKSVTHSVLSNPLQPRGLQPTSILCPWDFPGKDTGVDWILFSKGIFLIQRRNPGLLHCRQILYCPSHCPDMISVQKGYCFSYSKKKFQLPLLPPIVVTVLPSLYIETTQKGLSMFTVFSLPIILNNYKELDHIEGWAPRNWCSWIVLEKTLESLLDSKEIKPVNPKWNQAWIFIGRFDVEASVLWPPDAKSLRLGTRGQQRMRWWNGITNSVDLSLSKLQ